MTKKTSSHSHTLLASSLTLGFLMLSSSAQAAGFAVSENSASGLGNAFAGAAASAQDASIIWFNPSGMAQLAEKTNGHAQLSSALHLVNIKTRFTDKGSSAPSSLGAATINGKTSSSETVLSPIPNLFYMRPINERLNFGLSVNAPYGSKVDYDNDWVGRYQATTTEMKTVNINPSLSWKVNDKLSLGAGVSAQYIEVSLGSAVDSAGACRQVATSVAAQTNSTALIDYCNGVYPKAAQFENDSHATVEGDGIGFGFNLGLSYQATEKTRIGASYRSKVAHDLDGKASYDVDNSLLPVIAQTGINTFTNRAIEASVDLPETVSLSLSHQVNDRLELLGDITWNGWSSFKELKVTEKATGAEVTKVDENWNDSTRVAIGANYQYNDRLKLRAGYAYDEEPIPSAHYLTPRIPGNDRTWLTVGANYKLNKKTNLDLGFAHVMMDETPIDNPGENGYSVRGLYSNDINILSAQLNYTF